MTLRQWCLLALLGLSFFFTLLVGAYTQFIHTPLRAPEEGLVLAVPKGTSLYKIASDLQKQHCIQNKWFFIWLARSEKVATRLQAGEYLISRGMEPKTFLEHMAKGIVVQYALTVVEGWTFKDLMTAVSKEPKLVHTLAGLNDQEIMARLGYPNLHPEGRFFPDTYYFPAGTLDSDFLKRAYQELSKRLDLVWQNKANHLPLKTPYDALILASIIQKESGAPSEYQEIAGVYIRRLRRKMLLQADPTLIYGLGSECNGRLTYKQLQKPTPYNTYLKIGLPITPIALVGMEALKAAVNPDAGGSLYFVSTNDGKHVFSKTLKEHNIAVLRYQKKKSTHEK